MSATPPPLPAAPADPELNAIGAPPDGAYRAGDPSACLGGGNVLALVGERGERVYEGSVVVRRADYAVHADERAISLFVDPVNKAEGSNWRLGFSSGKLGDVLRAQHYPVAERFGFESPGRPGVDVAGNGRACNQVLGEFHIHELVWVGRHLARLTATFARQCDGRSAVLSGCVHYENPLLRSEDARAESRPVPTPPASAPPKPLKKGKLGDVDVSY
jgi:hypothetical protein